MSVLFSAEPEPKEGRAFRALVFKQNENDKIVLILKIGLYGQTQTELYFKKLGFGINEFARKMIFDEDEKNLTHRRVPSSIHLR